MDKNTANRILSETEVGYDLIAGKFSQTRKHFWAELEFIRNYIKANDNVLDFGCGNGRLFPFLKEKAEIKYQGVDVSAGLIEKAKELNLDENAIFSKINPTPRTKATNGRLKLNENNEPAKEVYFKNNDSQRLVRGRQASLAFEDNFFNAIYSIAVFHHIPSKEVRLELARELFRVTKKNGYVVVTVWNLWQKNYKKNIFINWFLKVLGVSIPPHQFFSKIKGKSFFQKIFYIFRKSGLGAGNWCGGIDWNDCRISFTDNQGKIFQRFHHAFMKGELKRLFESAGFETERCELVSGRNIVYIGKKK